MIESEDFAVDLDLLEMIHDVALGQVSWVDVLVRLRREFRAGDALLSVYGDTPGQVSSLAMAVGGRLPWRLYAEHFASIDPFAAAMRGAGDVHPGVAVTGDQVVPAGQFTASEFYNDWFRPNDLRHTAGAYVPIGPGRLLQLGVPRAADAGAYTDEERVRLQRYFNHIRRAVVVGEVLGAPGRAPDVDAFVVRYRLTSAESALVRGLVESGSLKRVAQNGRKSYNTLRAQLQSVFLKTGTRSQVDLIRLFHQGETLASDFVKCI
jgi:hypothetical protein